MLSPGARRRFIASLAGPRPRAYNARMHPPSRDAGGLRLARRWTHLALRTTLLFVVGMAALWAVGVEGIWGHATPFYALWAPVFEGVTVPLTAALVLGAVGARARLLPVRGFWRIWLARLLLAGALGVVLAQAWQTGPGHTLGQLWPHVRVALVAAVGLYLWHGTQRPTDTAPTRPHVVRTLLGLMVFYVLFACAVAALRGWPDGVIDAYSRQAYEYVGDIGKTPTIREFFSRYTELHPFLSLHAKAQPPGPVALLWLFSFVVGVAPLALSLASVCFASLALVPLYGWVRDWAGPRTALTACALYSLTPAVVLFSATSAETLFPPFMLLALWLFGRALNDRRLDTAVAAGAAYGGLALLKFTLLTTGAWFGFVGLWQAFYWRRFGLITRTALLMAGGALALQGLVWLWSGFDLVGTFQLAYAQFTEDQRGLDVSTPRYPGGVYRVLNPLAWFWFAGIPVSLLFILRVIRPRTATMAWVWCAVGTLLVINLTYLGRGEAERSAYYIYPFIVGPAADRLQQAVAAHRDWAPFLAMAALLAAQAWATEAYFYTYW